MARHTGRLELTWTDKDRALLSTGDGKYDYTFTDHDDPRVREVRLLREVDRIEAPTPADRPNDLPEPTVDNLLITGDAMHALDALAKTPEWAAKYRGKVKLVYIDPPFNTGQAFTQYEDNIEHSIWLTMLRDRLRQIKPLLSKDGSVWVHLDHVEVHRCRSVMDEILGSDNFAAEVAWQKADSTRNDAKTLSVDHDTLLVYRASPEWSPNRLPRTAESDARFSSPDRDPQPWFDDNPTAPGAKTHQGMVYAIEHPMTGERVYPARGRCWWTQQSQILEIMNEYAPYELRDLGDVHKRAELCGVKPDDVRQNVMAVALTVPLAEARVRARERYDQGEWPQILLRSGGEGGLGRKAYVPNKGLVASTWWTNDLVGHNREAKAEVKAIFPNLNAFATPKPERLLERVIQIGSDPGDIVLDCFAGSGTTAAVAHKMGRRWVTSELIADTVEAFTKPRLIRMLKGDDPGGVTTSSVRVAANGVSLPLDVDPKAAQQFQTTLGRVLGNPPAEGDDLEAPPLTLNAAKVLAGAVRDAQKRGELSLGADDTATLLALLGQVGKNGALSEVDVTKSVKTELNRRTRTRDAVTVKWHGGGGFTHLEVAPSMYEVDDEDGDVYLSPEAINGMWSRSVAAQLKFTFTPDHPVFCGVRGRQRLAVVDGVADEIVVHTVVEQLGVKEKAVVVAKVVLPEAQTLLTELSPGSRLRKAPRDLFPKRTVK
ncbi:site-specific DNA-methyltransferase [Rhodococcus sp. WS1]|uniref:site-specific DNA-methyltransferase n=1 Tax=unclassified Rhodococcus (in: high G+C Gram-positive bacteria) TaxID=192944 RepID=UPI001142DB9A|nr:MULTISPECIES: site-specific DNA-methyltransferase [unclassified Rhodococcus (in: high G+C Gram-positive bacteria)]ROZ56309.1 site-specific DNA-methyltransferase [Rhodococcus sp. WS1]TQC40501.1 site-specific DNA-methyltransferase [Rhodococcus sp. WS7]